MASSVLQGKEQARKRRSFFGAIATGNSSNWSHLPMQLLTSANFNTNFEHVLMKVVEASRGEGKGHQLLLSPATIGTETRLSSSTILAIPHSH